MVVSQLFSRRRCRSPAGVQETHLGMGLKEEKTVTLRNTAMQYTAIKAVKIVIQLRCKVNDNFLISAENLHCGYSLEPPLLGGFNVYLLSSFKQDNKIMYTSVNPT